MTQPSGPFIPPTAEELVDFVLTQLADGATPTPADVEAQVSSLLVGTRESLRPQREAIVREVLRRTTVRIGPATSLVDATDHIDWLAAECRDDWRLWSRLHDFLRCEEHFALAPLRELDRSSDMVLSQLESPAREGRWDRRGLVVGDVQSGKTTHYTALLAKALDAGFQIAIVLAGVHKSLRAQTQSRLDKHLIGKRTELPRTSLRRRGPRAPHTPYIGVAERDRKLGRAKPDFALWPCTTAGDSGDFRREFANQLGIAPSKHTRLVFVVKKNASILRNLYDWLASQLVSQGGNAAMPRIAAPALIIDDEADHASMNVSKDADADPTAINASIRQLLTLFDRVGFVGYTATPFANIFIPPNTADDTFGPDLFPSSFIVNLRAPADYVGPAAVFGREEDADAGIDAVQALPMHVLIPDADSWLPAKHRKNFRPVGLPDSLREALRLFVLACAAREARGHVNSHNTMLVHVTRFVAVQREVHRLIQDEVATLHDLCAYSDGQTRLHLEESFRGIWNERLVASHEGFADAAALPAGQLPSFSSVWACVPSVLGRIEVALLNGTAADTLRYADEPNGLFVIAVGGDKLSRGLTLEGLSVSYFLRTSRMYDTLMQMGRWFGYRPGYLDLCRVYTPQRLYDAFREISLATAELREEFDEMAACHRSPLDFGLRVRTPSDRLLITSANKLRAGDVVSVRFAGTLVQSLAMPRAGERADRNRRATVDLLTRLAESRGAPERTVRGAASSHFLWHGVPHDMVTAFFREFEAEDTYSFRDRCDRLRAYVNDRIANGELTEWTVAVISKAHRSGAAGSTATIAGLTIPLVERSASSCPPASAGHNGSTADELLRINALVGSADEAVDLDSREFLPVSQEVARNGSPRQTLPRQLVRESRPASRGLLLLYLLHDAAATEPEAFVPAIAVSFPASPSARPISYTVNGVWLNQFGLGEDWDDGGNGQ